jgi:hypothetical protein
MYHVDRVGEVHIIKKYIPTFFNRYNDMYQSFYFLRERIINEDNLYSYYLTSSRYTPANPDDYYKIRAIENENLMAKIIDLARQSDSDSICSDLIG